MSDEPTKEELREQAREAGLPVSGTKEEIQARLDEADAPSDMDPATGARTAGSVPSPAIQAVEDQAERTASGEWTP